MTVRKDGKLTGTLLCLTVYCFSSAAYWRRAAEKQKEISSLQQCWVKTRVMRGLQLCLIRCNVMTITFVFPVFLRSLVRFDLRYRSRTCQKQPWWTDESSQPSDFCIAHYPSKKLCRIGWDLWEWNWPSIRSNTRVKRCANEPESCHWPPTRCWRSSTYWFFFFCPDKMFLLRPLCDLPYSSFSWSVSYLLMFSTNLSFLCFHT